MNDATLRTPAQARAWLDRHGVTVSQWARAHGYEPSVVLALLNGRTRGRWGQAFDAAVALGLRPRPDVDEADPLGRRQVSVDSAQRAGQGASQMEANMT